MFGYVESEELAASQNVSRSLFSQSSGHSICQGVEAQASLRISRADDISGGPVNAMQEHVLYVVTTDSDTVNSIVATVSYGCVE